MTQRQGIEAGKAFVRFGVEDAEFKKGLMAARERLQAFGKSVAAIGAGFAAAGAIGLAPFVAGLRSLTTAGDLIDKASQRAGLAADEFQRLRFALEQSGGSGADAEKLARSLAASAFQLQRGSATYVEAAEALGVSLDDLTTGSTIDRINALANAYAEAGDKAVAFGALQVLAGRGAAQLIPLANGGRDALIGLGDQFDRVNLGASGDVIKDAAAFTDAVNILRTALRSLSLTIGASVSGPLASIAEPIAASVGAVREFTEANRGLVAGFGALAAGVAALGVAGVAIGGLATALGVAIVFIPPAVALLAPLVPVILGISAGVALIAAGLATLEIQTGQVSSALVVLGRSAAAATTGLRAAFGGIVDALASSDFEAAGELAGLGFVSGLAAAFKALGIGSLLAALGIDGIEEAAAAAEFRIGQIRAGLRRGGLGAAGGGGGSEPPFGDVAEGVRRFNRGTFDSNPRLGAFSRGDMWRQLVSAVNAAAAEAKRAADGIEEGRFDDPAGVAGGVFR